MIATKNPYEPAIVEIEKGLSDHATRVMCGVITPYSFSDLAFKACINIFVYALSWKLWVYTKDMAQDDRHDKIDKAGADLRKLILEHTGIDMHEVYK